MGISPLAPRLIYALVFRAPFNLNLELLALNLCGLVCECKVISGCMMRLAITGQVLYPQVFKGDIA